jgi:hypothetical protein
VATNPVFRFQLKYMSYGSWLSEYLYGFIMVAMVSGMLTGLTWIGEDKFRWVTTLLLIIVTFGVNISWGLIDGFTVVYGGLVDKAREEASDQPSSAPKMYRLSKEDGYTVLAIMSCDALAVVPVILPYIILGYTTLAWVLSILIASSAMACIIYLYAKHTGRRKWLAASVFFVLMLIASLLAYYYGW